MFCKGKEEAQKTRLVVADVTDVTLHLNLNDQAIIGSHR